MSRPVQPSIGITQERAATPSISTVQVAAFAEPAAVFRSVQFEIVAQHVEQRGVRRGVDVMDPAVDIQADHDLVMLIVTSQDTVCIQTCKRAVPQGRLP